MKSETATSENPAAVEEDFVLKIELGLVFPVRAKGTEGDEGVIAKSQQLADLLVAHIKAFDVKPEVTHLLNGEAMKRSDFEELKARAKEQAAQVAQMLQAIVGALPEGAHVQAFGPNGEIVTPESAAAEDSTGDEPLTEAAAPGAVGDAVEPGDKTFRVGPPRTLQ